MLTVENRRLQAADASTRHTALSADRAVPPSLQSTLASMIKSRRIESGIPETFSTERTYRMNDRIPVCVSKDDPDPARPFPANRTCCANYNVLHYSFVPGNPIIVNRFRAQSKCPPSF